MGGSGVDEMGEAGIGHDQVGSQRVEAAGHFSWGQQGVHARGDRADAGRAEVDGHIVHVGGQHQAHHRPLSQSSLAEPGCYPL